MKVINKLTSIFSIVLIVIFVSYVFIYKDKQELIKESENMSESTENYENKIVDIYDSVASKVIPYIVNAKVNIDNKEYIGEIIEDKGNGKTYHIEIDNSDNWYEKYYVTVLYNTEEKVDKLTDEEIEIYVNLSSLNPTSEYFIWVDLYRIETYVLKRNIEYYKVIKRLDCATGKDITPTKRGFYQIEAKGTHFYSRDNTYICYNYLQYSGSYLLHSFPYSLNKKVLDDSLGQRVSNGCVRFSFEDSKYLFDNIEIGSQIWVN